MGQKVRSVQQGLKWREQCSIALECLFVYSNTSLSSQVIYDAWSLHQQISGNCLRQGRMVGRLFGCVEIILFQRVDKQIWRGKDFQCQEHDATLIGQFKADQTRMNIGMSVGI